jgi:hypothetical protein
VAWEVRFHDEFDPEFDRLPRPVQIAALIHLKALEQLGPQMGRPCVDTLAGAKHANMKGLRFDADGGVSPSPLTRDAKPLCLLLTTNRASAKPVFIKR